MFFCFFSKALGFLTSLSPNGRLNIKTNIIQSAHIYNNTKVGTVCKLSNSLDYGSTHGCFGKKKQNDF